MRGIRRHRRRPGRVGELARLDRGGSPPWPAAAAAYLATLSGPEQRNTWRAYRSALKAPAAEFAPPGAHFPVADLDEKENVEALTRWFSDRWGQAAPATFNRHLDALRSATAFWMDQEWLTTDPTRRLRRRGRAPDRTRALAVADVDAIFEMDAPIGETSTVSTIHPPNRGRGSDISRSRKPSVSRRPWFNAPYREP